MTTRRPGSFIATREHRRFIELADAVRRHATIGTYARGRTEIDKRANSPTGILRLWSVAFPRHWRSCPCSRLHLYPMPGQFRQRDEPVCLVSGGCGRYRRRIHCPSPPRASSAGSISRFLPELRNGAFFYVRRGVSGDDCLCSGCVSRSGIPAARLHPVLE